MLLHQVVSCSMDEEKREYNLNVGKAIDVLRHDVPDILSQAPDLTVFTENIRVSDPSGQKLQGKRMYSQMCRLVRGMSSLTLRNDSAVQARFFYDEPNAQIKAKVNAELRLAGGSLMNLQRHNEPLHLSVVSLYKLDRASGKVNHQVVERVDLDGTELEPFKFLNADRDQLLDWVTGGAVGGGAHVGYPTTCARPSLPLDGGSATLPALGGSFSSSSSSVSSSSSSNLLLGWGTRQKRERAMGGDKRGRQQSRIVLQASSNSGEQKFDVYGNLIPPGREDTLTGKVRNADGSRVPEEAKPSADAAREKGRKHRNPGLMDFLRAVVDEAMPKQCEDDNECPSPQRCCDFGFANVCCSGGLGAATAEGFMPAYNPVPARINEPGSGGGNGGRIPPQDLPDFGGTPP